MSTDQQVAEPQRPAGCVRPETSRYCRPARLIRRHAMNSGNQITVGGFVLAAGEGQAF